MVQPSTRRFVSEAALDIDQALQDVIISDHGDRLVDVETLGGLTPGDVSDATIRNIIANPITTSAIELAEQITSRAKFINIKEAPFHAVGDGIANDTVVINAAHAAAKVAKKKLYAPGGTYLYDGYHEMGQGIEFALEGDGPDITVFRQSQAKADAGNSMFRLTYDRYSDVEALAITANIKPNQQRIYLSSVAGLSAGMVIQVSSNRLWYNGHRDVYYAGEIHKINYVSTVSNYVTVADLTRDLYSTTDTLTIRAWTPNKVSIKNLSIETPYPATGVTSVGISLQQCMDARIENVSLKGFRNAMITNNLSWHSRFIDVKFRQDDELDTTLLNGYGIESNGSVGTHVDRMDSKGLRRSFDAGSISQTTLAAVERDWKVTNSIVRGGGAWFPNTTAISYGIGMHGSSENGVVSGNFIEDCSQGVNARGRNTTVENNTFAGSFNTAVSLYEGGAGLIVRNNTYDSFNYPNKFTNLDDMVAGSGCGTFVQLGVTSGDINTNCNYDLPIIVENNAAKGLTKSFVQISRNDKIAKNLRVVNNHIEATPGSANTFTTFDAVSTATNLTGSVFHNNNEEAINGAITTWSTNLVIAYRESQTLKFKVDGAHYARISADTVVRIPRVAKAGQRITVMFSADAGASGFFRLQPESTSITTMGATLSSILKATATGSALTGTSGGSRGSHVRPDEQRRPVYREPTVNGLHLPPDHPVGLVRAPTLSMAGAHRGSGGEVGWHTPGGVSKGSEVLQAIRGRCSRLPHSLPHSALFFIFGAL
ncbi:hypothetical protein QFZ79_002885 [Arthrobacter sp. V4I6]|uniref:right-handed parallel beta-helix repeat-containing protein n=1 Tax=Arthrobacter sp. V4I6 TaxID=3042281 RepID=UPI0027891F3B|nr:right-handed parallel beta-helix repeat-containing protein [Arthrobacter sp. V4I6]MDQ0854774.1 hypothetical protein [Arthrobacter sp. V4I6]